MKNTLIWIARILAILLIIFFAVFALDAFQDPQWLLSLTMQMIPSAILIILTIVAWWNEKWGGFLFLLAALAILLHYGSYIIASPALVIALLLLAAGYLVKEWS